MPNALSFAYPKISSRRPQGFPKERTIRHYLKYKQSLHFALTQSNLLSSKHSFPFEKKTPLQTTLIRLYDFLKNNRSSDD